MELDAKLDAAIRDEPGQTGRTVNLEAFRERNIDAGAGLIKKDKVAPISDYFKAALVRRHYVFNRQGNVRLAEARL